MAKENFDRSKPHLNIGVSPSTDSGSIDFRDTTSSLVQQYSVLDNADGRDDGLASINIGPADLIICHQTDGGSQFCVDTTNQAAWQWSPFRLPIFQTDQGVPLLVSFDLADVLNAPNFVMNQSVGVRAGQIGEWSILSLTETASTTQLASESPPTPTAFEGTALVVGFAEFAIPTPTSFMMIIATGAVLLTRRLRHRRRV